MRLRVFIAFLAILISIACVVASVDLMTDPPPRSESSSLPASP